MSRAWLVPCLLLWIGCSDGPERSGFLDGKSQPTLLLRCQEGRIAAYVTMETPDEAEGSAIPVGAVPVQLDSTPPC